MLSAEATPESYPIALAHRALLLLQQPRQRPEGIVGGRRGLGGAVQQAAAAEGVLDLALVLVVVTVQAEQLPVAAVGRVAVVVVVACGGP
jgi:hypothetical protein